MTNTQKLKQQGFSLLSRNEEDKKVLDRIKVLLLAEELNNVAEACRRLKVDRTSFYKWKKRYEEFGCQGLRDRPPQPAQKQKIRNPDLSLHVVNVALAHPDWGCNRLEQFLKKQGYSLSAPSIQKILNKHQLGSRKERQEAAAAGLQEKGWAKQA